MVSKNPDERKLIAAIASDARWGSNRDPYARLRLAVIQSRHMAERAAERAQAVERELAALGGDGGA